MTDNTPVIDVAGTLGGSRCVLVVDDDLDLREMTAMALRSEGYGVTTAANGEEALVAVAKESIGLILLDMRMPIMDGPSFLRVYGASTGSRVPVVMFTAGSPPPSDVAADGYLAKPFDIDVLLSTVRRWIPQP